MVERVGLVVLNQFTAIGVVNVGGKELRVLPTRDLLGFLTKLINRVGGDSPDVTLVSDFADITAPIALGPQQAFPDIVIGEMGAILDMIRAAVAQEIAMQPAALLGNTAMSDVTTGASACCDSVLIDVVQPAQQGPAQPFRAAAVGASPYTYIAHAREAAHITGGTLTGLQIVRGAAALALDALVDTQIVELNAGDSLLVGYTTAPTITIIPR